MKNGRVYFTPELFRFLRELKENNNRDWFLENKDRYEKVVKQPMLSFIADLAPQLQKISGYLVADPRPHGGSMFRIYRDVRFSQDKSPYKTVAAAHFPHRKAGQKVHVPGFYLHLEPGQCFSGAGIWRPDSKTLVCIRKAILNRSSEWKKLRRSISLDGDRLTRPPKGFPADHPLIEDIKHKDFISGTEFTEEQVCSPHFLSIYVEDCRKYAPLNRFLCSVLGLPW